MNYIDIFFIKYWIMWDYKFHKTIFTNNIKLFLQFIYPLNNPSPII